MNHTDKSNGELETIIMFKIKSTVAASYITAKTGIVAEIVYDDKGQNHFEFDKESEVMESYREYRAAINENEEHNVNIINYNKAFDSYKSKINKRRKEERTKARA